MREAVAIVRVESLQHRRNLVLWVDQILLNGAKSSSSSIRQIHQSRCTINIFWLYGVPLEATVFTPFFDSMERPDKKYYSLARARSGIKYSSG